ncbi:MAG: FeoB-associated Cys-rich membrane protein [Deltaproteobacteria bacterium]|nr:FeoB-associated Cys-rich membrane protein [Deltaproteobacteria bacterium]
MLQDIVVILIVALTCAWLFNKSFGKRKSLACSGCRGCPVTTSKQLQTG